MPSLRGSGLLYYRSLKSFRSNTRYHKHPSADCTCDSGSVYWYDCRILYNEQKTFFAPLRMMIRNIQNSSVMHQLTEYRGDELQYMEEYYRNVSSYIDRLEKRTSHRDLIAKNLILGNNVQPLINKWGILHPNANYYAVLAYMTEEASSGRLEDYVTRCNRVSELISIDLSQYGKCTGLRSASVDACFY